MFSLCERLCDVREDDLINKRINKELKNWDKINRNEIKLLLLGIGESGKTTFLKQMKIIHGDGFSELERRKFQHLVYQNIFVAAQSLIRGMSYIKAEFANPLLKEKSSVLMNIDSNTAYMLSKEHIEILNELWQDSEVQKSFSRKREYYLPDSTKYFLSQIDRIASPDYIPTENDILRIRHASTGISEHVFQFEKSFRIVDVGGQRSERKKWIHCFDNVTSVIFLVAISEYDQVLLEDHLANRMEESKALFNLIMTCKSFEKASTILFLNKVDVFKEKITLSNLSDFFPEYTGPKGSVEDAQKFILGMFVKLSSNKNRFYSHFTCATDTENIRVIFDVVKEAILLQYIDDFNMA